MDAQWLLEKASLIIPLILSLSVHEWAHAVSAYKLGDDTASRMGRMTLDPIVHIDPIGTLLVPLMGVPFGWAKPVPVNPANFRPDVSMAKGMMITAAAGPAANVVLAVLCTVVYALTFRFAPTFFVEQEALIHLLGICININVVLALFNMLPIPPLDGGRIVEGFVPYKWRSQWDQFSRYSPLLLLGVLMFGGGLLAWPLGLANQMLGSLIGWIV